MSRRRAAETREVLPDPKYGDKLVTKFANCLMLEGRRSVAERIIYGAFDQMQQKAGQDHQSSPQQKKTHLSLCVDCV